MSVGFKQAGHGRTEHVGAAGVLEVFCKGSFRRWEWIAGGMDHFSFPAWGR